MIASLALFLIAQSPDDGPLTLAPGSSSEFQSAVFAVQANVDDGRWDEAARLASRLPRFEFTLQWDDSAVPEPQRAFFAEARDEAIRRWKVIVPELKVTLADKGEVKVDFVKELPPSADSPGPAGAVFLHSPDAADPAVEGVFALLRSENKRPIDAMDVTNETQHAIGAFLGLARQPRIGSLMYRSEEPYLTDNVPSAGDRRLAIRIVESADRVRKEVAAKRSPGAAAPVIFVSPSKMTPPEVSQGEPMAVSVQVTNRGKGTMDFRAVPDCGCFVIGPYQEIVQPGDTAIIPIQINTFEFTGHLQKTLFIYSNDPVKPIVQIPLDTIVRPAYWFKNVKDDPTLIVEENGGTFETILVIDDAQKFKVTRVAVTGVSAAIEFEPWKGTLPNPETGEPAKPRRGYKIKALVAPGITAGRVYMTIDAQTDDARLKSLYHNVTVQRGIVAVPLSVYFGQIGKDPVRGSVVLTRPGRPYKITKVASDTEFVTAAVEPYRGDTEYKIVVTYNGRAPIGRFFGKVLVHTDDPKQPIVEVPFEGTVS